MKFKKEDDLFTQALDHVDGWLNTTRLPDRTSYTRTEVQNMLLDLRIVVSQLDTVAALEARILKHHELMGDIVDPDLESLCAMGEAAAADPGADVEER